MHTTWLIVDAALRRGIIVAASIIKLLYSTVVVYTKLVMHALLKSEKPFIY